MQSLNSLNLGRSVMDDEDDSSTSDAEEEGKRTAASSEKRPAGQKDGRSGAISNRSGLVMDDEDNSSTSDAEEEGKRTAASSEKRPAEQKDGQSIHTSQGTSNRPLVKVDYYISSFTGRFDDDDEDSTSDSEEESERTEPPGNARKEEQEAKEVADSGENSRSSQPSKGVSASYAALSACDTEAIPPRNGPPRKRTRENRVPTRKFQEWNDSRSKKNR